MLKLLHLVRPCSKKMCKCYSKAFKLALYIPINKKDEIENHKKINDLYNIYKLCSKHNKEFNFDTVIKKKD